MTQKIGFEVSLSEDHDQAIVRVTDALKDEGFGVLTTIDVRNTLKEKLGEEFRKFTILGACNPQLAHMALSHDPLVGLLLPCNVTVEEAESGSVVRFINPDAMFAVMNAKEGDPLREVARDAGARLTRVREVLGR